MLANISYRIAIAQKPSRLPKLDAVWSAIEGEVGVALDDAIGFE